MAVWYLFHHYFAWHYSAAIRAWWRICRDLLWFLFHFFSIAILLRTLFSPWHRLAERYPQGFRPELAAETLVVNFLMRLIGLVLRLLILFLALLVLLLSLALVFVSLIVWLLAPLLILVLFAIGFYLTFLA